MTTPSSFSNHSADAVRLAGKAADTVNEVTQEAKNTAAEVARNAKYEFQKVKYELERAAQQTEKLAKENPWTAAATMFGIGALVGALAYKLLSPTPTVTRVLGIDHLPDAARNGYKQFGKQMKQFKKLF